MGCCGASARMASSSSRARGSCMASARLTASSRSASATPSRPGGAGDAADVAGASSAGVCLAGAGVGGGVGAARGAASSTARATTPASARSPATPRARGRLRPRALPPRSQRSSSSATVWAEGRAAGSFARQARHRASRIGSTPGARRDGRSGASSMIARSTATVDGPTKGGRPQRMTHRTPPRPHASAGGPAGRPRVCSGDMNSGVPRIVPVAVRRLRSCTSRASPKSMSFPPPCGSTRMFPGLRSRWTIPRACAWASPRATSRRARTASRGSRSPAGGSLRASERPSMSSKAMKARPPTTPASRGRTIAGWSSAAPASASRARRTTSSGSATPGSMIFRATRPRASSQARSTTPMPPRPSSSRRT